MDTSWPATTTLPVRCGPLTPLTATWTTPELLPEEPWAIEAHGTLLEAVHGQPSPVVTVMLVDPPADPTE